MNILLSAFLTLYLYFVNLYKRKLFVGKGSNLGFISKGKSMTTLPTAPECVKESFSVDLDQDKLKTDRALRKKIREKLIRRIRKIVRATQHDLGHGTPTEAIDLLRDATLVAVNREVMLLINDGNNQVKGV